MNTIHPLARVMPTDSQRSREAAERYAIRVALRERRRSRALNAARGRPAQVSGPAFTSVGRVDARVDDQALENDTMGGAR